MTVRVPSSSVSGIVCEIGYPKAAVPDSTADKIAFCELCASGEHGFIAVAFNIAANRTGLALCVQKRETIFA